MSKPTLKCTVMETKVDDHGVLIVVAVTDGECAADFKFLVPPEFKAPAAGEEFDWALPLRAKPKAKK